MNKTEILESCGFRRCSVLELADVHPWTVTQVENENSTPVPGRRNRKDGTFPWAVRVAPSQELFDAAIDGSLFVDNDEYE